MESHSFVTRRASHCFCHGCSSRLLTAQRQPAHMEETELRPLPQLPQTGTAEKTDTGACAEPLPWRYSTRHGRVLRILHQHMQENCPKGTAVVVDLDEQPYQLPADLPTDLRPDLVVLSPGCLHIFELTIC